MKKIYGLIALTLILSATAFADVRLPDAAKPTPQPKQPKMIDARMTIRLDKNANDTVLVIPKNQLKQFRAELELLDQDSDTAAALSDSNGGVSRSQTIVGGMFLSLAFVFGGVWLARSRKTDGKTNKTIVAGIVLFLAGSAATFVFANAGPPSTLRSISSKLFDKQVFNGWKRAGGNIKISVSTDSSDVELIVPDKEEKAVQTEE